MNDVKVYWNNVNSWDGSIINIDKDNIKISQIIIGRMHSNVSGNKLSTILGSTKNKYEMFSFHPFGDWKNEQFTDITEWVWNEYIKRGRCLFDKEHNEWWINDDNRYTYVNNTRRCKTH